MASEPPLVGRPVNIGDVQVTPVSDGFLRFRPTDFFPRSSADTWEVEAHRAWLDGDGMLVLPMASFVIRAPGTTLLVDCGLNQDDGDDWRGGRLPDALSAAGLTRDEIDVVVFTHLHVDHVGWATDAGSPFFPRATYRCHGADWEWSATAQSGLHGARLAGLAERLDPIGDGERLAPGVTAVATPGHTPGHIAVVVSGPGERAFLLGDVAHCPVQLTPGDWKTWGDVDPVGAARTRDRLLREIEGDDIVASAHFPELHFGRLVSAGEGRTWVPLS
ncbi:MAG TPA: MBL fold metallo-hydrolase [Acidimicrobiia bacterium]|nr:MBL fold metallo-hydrolase [Acidimicrobiia bacterium]